LDNDVTIDFFGLVCHYAVVVLILGLVSVGLGLCLVMFDLGLGLVTFGLGLAISKGKGQDTCYSAVYMSQTRDQQRFYNLGSGS